MSRLHRRWDSPANGHNLRRKPTAADGHSTSTSMKVSVQKNLRRPALQQLLEEIGPGDILVVARLDRLSRSLIDFVDLMQIANRQRWQIVALDLGVDTTTPAGQMLANVMASFAEYERQLIGERTRVALAAKKAAGHKLGGPSSFPITSRTRSSAPEPTACRCEQSRTTSTPAALLLPVAVSGGTPALSRQS